MRAARPTLLPPAGEVGFLGDAAVPADLYFVTRQPVAIVGMGYPARIDWKLLHEAGVQHVVCLTHDDAPYDCAPLSHTAIALQDLYAAPAAGPRDPEVEAGRVGAAADAVVAAVHRGDGVAVHCRGGRGRAGTVIGVALVRLGHDPAGVVAHLDAIHRARGKGGWPEHPWQAEIVRHTR
jgi:hypothetical protein